MPPPSPPPASFRSNLQRRPTSSPRIEAGVALDGLQPRRADPRVLDRLRRSRRRRRVAEVLLDRRDHRGRLLGRGARAVELQARAAVHAADSTRPSEARTLSGPPVTILPLSEAVDAQTSLPVRTAWRAAQGGPPAERHNPYSGMLPCLRLGPGWRLVSSVSSAAITLGRVS